MKKLTQFLLLSALFSGCPTLLYASTLASEIGVQQVQVQDPTHPNQIIIQPVAKKPNLFWLMAFLGLGQGALAVRYLITLISETRNHSATEPEDLELETPEDEWKKLEAASLKSEADSPPDSLPTASLPNPTWEEGDDWLKDLGDPSRLVVVQSSNGAAPVTK